MTDSDFPEPLGAPEGPSAPVTPPASEPAMPPAPLPSSVPEEHHGWEDKDGDGILQGDEIDLSDPFDAIDGEH